MIFIIGGSGFVGSAFVRYCERNRIAYRVIDRDNYFENIGRSCDVLVNANGNSKKLIAESDNVFDFKASVTSVKKSLYDFKYNSYIYLSSGDVYPYSTSKETTKENKPIDVSKLSAYGFHKYLAELCVKQFTKKWWIFRLTGMVGVGLKKNSIYDIFHGNKLWLHPSSRLQFINTDDVVDIIMSVIMKTKPNQIFNVAGKGLVKLGDVLSLTGRDIEKDYSEEIILQEMDTKKIEKYVKLPKSITSIMKYNDNQ